MIKDADYVTTAQLRDLLIDFETGDTAYGSKKNINLTITQKIALLRELIKSRK